MGNEIVNVTADSASMVLFDDYLRYNPFAEENVESAIQTIYNFGKGINRASLYFAWMLGKFADSRKLKDAYGIQSYQELAQSMQTTVATIQNYRAVYELTTEQEVRKLANLGVSVNALLVIARAKKDHPEESRQVMEMLLGGWSPNADRKALASDVEKALVDLVEANIRSCNLLPGGEPPAESAEAEKSLYDLTNGDTDTADEKILKDTAITPEVVEDEEDEEEDGEPSQNKKDINYVFRSLQGNIRKIQRGLKDVSDDFGNMMDVVREKEDIILGDEETHNKYVELLEELYDDWYLAVKSAIKEVVNGRRAGYCNHPIPVPSTVDIEQLFHQED